MIPAYAKPASVVELKPGGMQLANIAERQGEQRAVLDLAAPLVKPGGRLVYVTCSVLPEENGDQVDWFLKSHGEFAAQELAAIAEKPVRSAGLLQGPGLLLTPRQHGTDGFFIAPLVKAA